MDDFLIFDPVFLFYNTWIKKIDRKIKKIFFDGRNKNERKRKKHVVL